MPIMWLDNVEFATTVLFELNIILKLKYLFTQHDKREIEFFCYCIIYKW